MPSEEKERPSRLDICRIKTLRITRDYYFTYIIPQRDPDFFRPKEVPYICYLPAIHFTSSVDLYLAWKNTHSAMKKNPLLPLWAIQKLQAWDQPSDPDYREIACPIPAAISPHLPLYFQRAHPKRQ